MKNNMNKQANMMVHDRASRTGNVVRVSNKVVKLFRHCGYLRTPPDSAEDGHERVSGHRGYEVRFMARGRQECQKIVHLLKACHIETGKPFNTGQRWRIPVYGRDVFVALKDCK